MRAAVPARFGPGTVVCLDLAGAPRRTTGFCALTDELVCTLAPLHSMGEIWRATLRAGPSFVSIDAPLSLPRGRRQLGDRSGPHFRECDRVLRARRIPFFPITLGPMRMLTRRGLALARRLTAAGIPHAESYPGGAQDVLGIPRKSAGIEPLRRGLLALGLSGEITRRDVSHDELDAATCAYVGWLWRHGRAEMIGDPTEGTMLMPREPRRGPEARGRNASPRQAC